MEGSITLRFAQAPLLFAFSRTSGIALSKASRNSVKSGMAASFNAVSIHTAVIRSCWIKNARSSMSWESSPRIILVRMRSSVAGGNRKRQLLPIASEDDLANTEKMSEVESLGADLVVRSFLRVRGKESAIPSTGRILPRRWDNPGERRRRVSGIGPAGLWAQRAMDGDEASRAQERDNR